MSAADRREELEALLWQRITPEAPGEPGRQKARKLVEDILAGADTYATALAAETLDGAVRDQRTRDRRDRLAEAARRTP